MVYRYSSLISVIQQRNSLMLRAISVSKTKYCFSRNSLLSTNHSYASISTVSENINCLTPEINSNVKKSKISKKINLGKTKSNSKTGIKPETVEEQNKSSKAFEKIKKSESKTKKKKKSKKSSHEAIDEFAEYRTPDEAKEQLLLKNLKVKTSSKKATQVSKGSTSIDQSENSSELVSDDKTKEYKLVNASQFDCEVNISPNLEELPSLKFGLDRTLFNPGVTVLQDPHSRVYNFDPYLQSIIDVDRFDFNKITQYIPASMDKALQNLAFEHNKQFISTSSSTTHMLCHLYFVMSNWRPIDTSFLSSQFQRMSRQFSRTLTCPASIKLTRHENGVYSIDSDKSFEREDKILSKLGHVMERMLTMPETEFNTYLDQPDIKLSDPEVCLYAYKLTRRMALRGQLDCADIRLPKKVFDLKTRAALPIRLDQANYKDYVGYEVNNPDGVIESYSREYYDLMRSAFLKYGMQVRIGNMDGCLVAYHNTSRIFGFQYISLKEMDERIFGSTSMGDQVFANSTQILEEVLDTITKDYPDKDMLVTFKSFEGISKLEIFIEFKPSKQENCENSQDSAFNNIAKYQLNCYSHVNGEKKTGPFNIKEQDDWDIYYQLKKLELDPLDLYNEYQNLRHVQATFYDYDRQGLPILQKLRALSYLRQSKSESTSDPVVFTSMS